MKINNKKKNEIENIDIKKIQSLEELFVQPKKLDSRIELSLFCWCCGGCKCFWAPDYGIEW